MRNIFEHYASGEALYTKIVAPFCRENSLTYMEFTVMMFLANNPQYDTATEIVKYRHLTKSHVSISLQGLQQKNLIAREYHEENHRTVHLSLTSAGKSLANKGHAVQKKYADIIFKGFTSEEVSHLMKLIGRIDKNIENGINTRISGEKQCTKTKNF